MIKLFTDSDLDGTACALIAELAFENEAEITHCTYRNLDDRVEAFLLQNSGDPVFITDLSVNEHVEKHLEERYQKGSHVQMIDHHATAMHFNDYEWGFVDPGDDKKTCAATLFYQFLLEKEKIERMESLEQFLELVRKYDTWEWEEDNEVDAKRLNDLFSIMGRETFKSEMLRRLTRDPDSFAFNESEEMILDLEERKIERYIHQKNRQLVQMEVDEYCIGLVHAESYHSELGNELNKRNSHLDFITIINDGSRRLGFRTIHDEADVSEFASRYGGGGYPKASGCEMNEDTFRIFVAPSFALKPLRKDPERNKLNQRNSESGTFYENHEGKIIYIRPSREDQWEIMCRGEVEKDDFEHFEDAERYVKRSYHAWLRSDKEVVEDFVRILPLTKKQIIDRYHYMIKSMLHQEEDALS
ncbi:DHH family phosphoesterase [Guptibacillus hwajinpoensis]|uniref:DHH family phosphoesterase n=1 Tax=Guptibacillus hwajinpoensis TaxID=208199 RepID=UPI00273D995E|nr:oligoribonuclease [Pseudalkalibacillus hwajinpoensis]WLR59357.1 oligoribonuclease [Pseudalkalibacillus hwajinpoensis]